MPLLRHDNAEDAKWFHANMRLIAEAAAKGLCEYLGVMFVDPYKEAEQPKVEGAAITLPVLRKGDSGDIVRYAMLILRDRGYYAVTIPASDKEFGPQMEAAVKKLQEKCGLKSDGIVGKDTWPKILGI